VTLTKRTAIVNGAATGLGRAAALALARECHRVVAAGLQPEELDETRRLIVEAGGEAISIEADVADERAIARVADAAQQEFGGTDVLVNNAAIYPSHPWYEADADEWDDVMRVNVRGYFLCARAVRPQMLERGGGAIVNIASVTFYEGTALILSYVASKGAVIGFTRALAREMAPHGITVNCVAPGPIDTDIMGGTLTADRKAALSADIPLGRVGTVDDVAALITFLMGADAGYITAATYDVNGGLQMS
jgi:NAD(P)-dependent dehydrogenase (short-subunit alcohol dehydrogenase family)